VAADLDPTLIPYVAQGEDVFETAWQDVYRNYRRRGRPSWLRDVLGFMLATGWYSVFALVTEDGTKCLAEIWNPATVYPSWDDDMTECAHIFQLSPAAANRMATRNNWSVQRITANVTAQDYWRLDDAGNVLNSVVLGTTLVKPETPEPRLSRIPIFTSPLGGLPDTGIITGDTSKWKEETGLSVVSTNENIYRYWNKWWTFSMQILRDTAQTRWFEKSASGKNILTPEKVYKRGAIFRGGTQDSIEPLAVPPIPVELRTTQLDMEAMLQRGGPSWTMFGSVQAQLSSYVISQIAASTSHIA
jgi:hypothetical protein